MAKKIARKDVELIQLALVVILFAASVVGLLSLQSPHQAFVVHAAQTYSSFY